MNCSVVNNPSIQNILPYFRPTPQKSGAAASGATVSPHASAVQNMLENGLTQFMQFRAQAAQSAHAVHASAAAAQFEHLLRNIGKIPTKTYILEFWKQLLG